jgi:hypothetical protein
MRAIRTSNRIGGRGIGPLGTTARVVVGGLFVGSVIWAT